MAAITSTSSTAKLPGSATWLLAASLLLSLLYVGHLARRASGPAQASSSSANYSLRVLPTSWQSQAPYARR